MFAPPSLERVGEQMRREGEKMLGAVVLPQMRLVLVRPSALNGQAALDFTDVCLDANLPPLFADHLGDLGELQELATNGHNLDAQPSFAIRAHAVALSIFFGESNAVEELVRLAGSYVECIVRYSGPGLYG